MLNKFKTLFIPILAILLITTNISCSFKNKGNKSYEEAAEIVTNTYKALLEREPDQGGLETYTKLLMRGFPTRYIENSIRDSKEYKLLQTK